MGILSYALFQNKKRIDAMFLYNGEMARYISSYFRNLVGCDEVHYSAGRRASTLDSLKLQLDNINAKIEEENVDSEYMARLLKIRSNLISALQNVGYSTKEK